MKSFFIKLGIGIFLVVGLFFWLASTLNYSDGFRSGRVVKVSKRGAIFKTIEGQLNIDTFGALKDKNQFSQTFMFTVESGNDELVEELRQASLSGQIVNIYYQEKYIKFSWRGDTKYFVYKVDRKVE
ncbi:hypothetical protein N9L20_05060 [Flavobacteriaceae bacterium]|nr:hypothetical protein [Flavobacteriaceae bacterium]